MVVDRRMQIRQSTDVDDQPCLDETRCEIVEDMLEDSVLCWPMWPFALFLSRMGLPFLRHYRGPELVFVRVNLLCSASGALIDQSSCL